MNTNMPAIEQALDILRTLYTREVNNRARVVNCANSLKAHGTLTRAELSFVAQCLKMNNLEFNADLWAVRLLTIELVPKTCWYSNVRTNVPKEIWDKLRTATYKKANHICEICGGKGTKWPVECHEIWHYDDNRRIQRLENLIALCPSCHEVKHIGLAGVNGRDHIAKKHLAIVNDWTKKQVDQYVTEVFKIWLTRSKHEWILNVEWLENQGIDMTNVKIVR